MTPVVLLRQIFDEAIAAVQPSICLPKHIPNPPLGRTIVLGAGKASAAMAKTLEEKWPWPLEGLVITRYGHKIENKRINIVEASHPIPDQIGLKASQQILEYTKDLTSRDLVIVLISGGGSSLLTLPANGLSLDDKKKINIVSFNSLTTDLCKKHKSNVILRGLRAVSDFEYEFQLAGMNRKLNNNIETIFLMSDVENQIISSRFVKEIVKLNGDIKKFTTKSTIKSLKEKYE